jgi:hypothetical protein
MVDVTAEELNSSDANVITDALWKFGVGSSAPKGPTLDAFVERISDRRVSIGELAISKAAKWSAVPRIADALVERLQNERNADVLLCLAESVVKLIKEKHRGYDIASKKLAEIALSKNNDNELRVSAINSLLFAFERIDIRGYASPDKNTLEELLADHEDFLYGLVAS